MAPSITRAEVKDNFTTTASDADLDAYIAVVDQADTCINTKGVSDAIAKQMKILGVRHLASSSNDRGAVMEERAVSGASRKFAERRSGETGYYEALRGIDQYGCVTLVLKRGALIQLRSAGREAPDT